MRGFNLLAATVFCGMFMPNLMGQSGTPQALSGDQVVERVSPSAVSILVGKGDGQLAGVGSGVVVRSDGVILTANHVVKGMREVQVRLKSGEIFDQVELIASDERRDVAALRIAATGLPVLPIGNSTNTASGATVFVVSNAVGLPWTASSGILSATRMADDVPGPAVATGFCSSPLHCRRDPAVACWWMPRPRYSESSLVHSASARTSILPCPSIVSPVSAMPRAARALIRVHGCNRLA